MRSTNQVRTYNRNESVAFSKTDEPFGGLSNMAGGFPLKVNGLRILTSEALYQACRFPHKPDVQRLIIEQASPMTAKMKSKPYRRESRPDWDQVRVKIMRWCLRVKLVQNWEKFSKLLLATGNRPIVEQSWKDDFWGAKPVDNQTLVGMNVLGRLLMELREVVRNGGRAMFLRVEPLAISGFLLLGQPIQPIIAEGIDQREQDSPVQPTLFNPLDQLHRDGQRGTAADLPVQTTLFDLPEQAEGAKPQGSSETPRMELAHALKPYPAYKDSGVSWLGKVPEHWEVRRLGSVTQILNGATPSSSIPEYWDGDIIWVTPDDLGKLKGRYIDDSSRRITREGYNASGTTLTPAGSIVISTRAPIGHLGILRVAACANQGCRLLVPQAATASEYLYHVLVAARPSLEALGQGSTFLELSRSNLRAFPIAFPPLAEQTAIVRFLDYVDRRIRRVIHARQRQMKLLEEYKQVLIHRAVIGQTDVRTDQPYPAYKNSGMPWLGQVPAHWEVRRIKTIARIRYGLGQPPKEMDGGIPMLRATNVSRGTICEKDLLHVDPSDVPSNRGAFLHAGEIVVVRSGAFTADSAIVPEAYDGVVAGYDMVLTALKISPRFLAAVLLTTYVRDDQLTVASMRSAQPHLNAEELGAALVALPPLPEQTAIVEYLDAQTAKIDAAIAAIRREIELLREYRTRLIADVVTGKADVREVTAQLPEELPKEGPELMDADEIAEGEAADDDAAAEALFEEEVKP